MSYNNFKTKGAGDVFLRIQNLFCFGFIVLRYFGLDKHVQF